MNSKQSINKNEYKKFQFNKNIKYVSKILKYFIKIYFNKYEDLELRE